MNTNTFLIVGYVFALILEACIKYQSTTRHVDPLHATAHFLRTTYTTAFNVSIQTVKIGAGFTNVTAELIQEVQTTHFNHIVLYFKAQPAL